MKDNERLGKGLEALFGGNVADIISDIENNTNDNEIIYIPLNKISPNPFQPRKIFDEDKLNELADSIRTHGVFTPIIVKKSSSGYNIVAGERRYRASQIAGLETIPSVIVDFDDKLIMEIALVENIQREGLNPLEEAKALKLIMEKNNHTQEELSKKLGKSRSHVANTLRLLSLNQKTQDMLLNSQITMGHAKILIGLEEDLIDDVLALILKDKLNVRDSENLVNRLKNKKNTKPVVKSKSNELEYIEKKVREKFGAKVKVSNNNISIKYENNDDLNRILEILDISLD